MKKETKKIIVYDSNNSGGSWWLTDDDWKNLEKAGWNIHWYGNENIEYGDYTSKRESKGTRFLGALASSCSKEFYSMQNAILEWEEITGQNADDEGCECCGEPHYFYEREIE